MKGSFIWAMIYALPKISRGCCRYPRKFRADNVIKKVQGYIVVDSDSLQAGIKGRDSQPKALSQRFLP